MVDLVKKIRQYACLHSFMSQIFTLRISILLKIKLINILIVLFLTVLHTSTG